MEDVIKKKISEGVKRAGKVRSWSIEQRKELSKRMSERMKGNTPGNKLTLKEAQDRINIKYPNIELLEYKDQYHIKYRCNLCGITKNGSLYRLTNDGCSNCKKINRKARTNTWNRISSDVFKKNFIDLVGDEYTLLSDYNKAEDFIKVRHNTCGYTWNVKARQFYSTGSRCPRCAKLVSKSEKELRDYVKSIYSGDIQYNVRGIIGAKELDIYIPEFKLAIEYNGTYWHSSIQKDLNYHFDKSSMCEQLGIRLIHIYEYEWTNERQRPILESIIKGALQLSDRIYARKCQVAVKKSIELKEFFNKNNIQGFRPGKFGVCLIYNNEVVMAYLFGNAYFGKGKYEYEVIRGATKLNINVVGGATKIWKYFIDKYNPSSCVYYVDYNYFNGSSVSKIPGMEFIKIQRSYKNYNKITKEVFARNPSKNREIQKLYKENIVYKIYNAGVKVYLWKRSNN